MVPLLFTVGLFTNCYCLNHLYVFANELDLLMLYTKQLLVLGFTLMVLPFLCLLYVVCFEASVQMLNKCFIVMFMECLG